MTALVHVFIVLTSSVTHLSVRVHPHEERKSTRNVVSPHGVRRDVVFVNRVLCRCAVPRGCPPFTSLHSNRLAFVVPQEILILVSERSLGSHPELSRLRTWYVRDLSLIGKS